MSAFPSESGPVVDLGGCDGCLCAGSGGGCAGRRVGAEVRRVLAAAGLGVLLLAAVPAALPLGWVRVPAVLVAAAGASIALLGTLGLRLGGARGDRAIRWGLRLVPPAMAGVVLLWGLVAVRVVGG